MEAVDEEQLEDDVRRVAGEQDEERRAQVRDAAQEALARDRDDRERQADGRDAEVGGGARCGVPSAPIAATSGVAAAAANSGEPRPDQRGEPDPLDADDVRQRRVSRAVGARDLRRRPVLEERDERRTSRSGSRSRGRARRAARAEVADDRGVDEDVERLRGERSERGQREPRGSAGRTASGASRRG